MKVANAAEATEDVAVTYTLLMSGYSVEVPILYAFVLWIVAVHLITAMMVKPKQQQQQQKSIYRMV